MQVEQMVVALVAQMVVSAAARLVEEPMAEALMAERLADVGSQANVGSQAEAVVVAVLLVASPHTARIGTGGSPHSPPAIAPLWRTLPQTACSPAHSTR